jgi:hypothetical protein
MTNRALQYIFGKTITRVFYPMQGDSPIQLPNQTVQVFVFEDRPGDDDALSGAGKIADGTQVSQSAQSPFHITYTLPPINKPDAVEIKVYWESLVFIGQATQQSQFAIRSFKVATIEQLDSIPGTTSVDIKQVFPSIENYVTDLQVADFLSLAEQELKTELKGQGILWQRVYDLQELRLCLAYKVVSDAAASQIMTNGDRHHVRFMMFKDKYNSLLKSVILGYDPDNTGAPTSHTRAEASYITARR